MSALVCIVKSGALADLGARARTTLEGTDMAVAGGRAVKLLLVDHFTELEADRHREGGEGFYADAAKSVSEATPLAGRYNGAVIAIDKIGIAQRLMGGTIKAVNKKYLAIPVPGTDAVGKTPADFPSLQFFKTKRGGGLKLQRAVASVVGHLRTGKNAGKSRNEADILGDVVLFWLVPEVTQAADPTVLPASEEMQAVAFTAMDEFLTRRLASSN